MFLHLFLHKNLKLASNLSKNYFFYYNFCFKKKHFKSRDLCRNMSKSKVGRGESDFFSQVLIRIKITEA